MITIFLQIWGGIFYLLNKIFFSRAERSNTVRERKIRRIQSWLLYLTGLPAWVIVLISEHNWIAACVESGGVPAMLVGLIVAWKGRGTSPGWLDSIAKLSTLMGLVLSVYEFGGIRNLSQFLELGIAAGFLMGTYMMAKDNAQGYLWLMLGNVSCAALMGIQGYFILMIQQLVSLVFVTDGFLVRRKKANTNSSELGSDAL